MSWVSFYVQKNYGSPCAPKHEGFSHGKEMPMSDQQSMNQQMEKEGGKPAIVKKIGNTTYKVTIHFSNTSQETVGDTPYFG